MIVLNVGCSVVPCCHIGMNNDPLWREGGREGGRVRKEGRRKEGRGGWKGRAKGGEGQIYKALFSYTHTCL